MEFEIKLEEYHSASAFDFDPQDIVESEVVEHPDPTNERSAARRVALQTLYEVDSAGHAIEIVLQQQLAAHVLTEKTRSYLQQLVMGVMENRQRLDKAIQQFAPEWPLEQVAIIDRNILRLAIYEFAIFLRTPVGVAIDEAVELGKLFGAEGTPRFINGVLGALADDPLALQQLLENGTEKLS